MTVTTVMSFVTTMVPIVVASMSFSRSLQSDRTKVSPIDCAKNSGPLQTLWGKTEYSVNERTLEGDKTLFTIPYTRSSPPFERINACGINPVDKILYCIIEISSISYLVRIDASQLEFVAKMPSWSWTAAFAADGTYYFAHEMKYYKVAGAHELMGYTDGLRNAEELTDLSSLSSFASGGHGGDMVVVSADVDGSGKADYIMSLLDSGRLRVTSATGTTKNWLLQSKPELPVTNQSYGAAWAYQNRVFFSQNSGGGIYEALVDTIDLLAGTIVFERVGPSFAKGSTDGMNCIDIEFTTKYSGRCGPKVGAYSALTGDDPVPAHGAKNVRPSQELMFLPSHDKTVTGYQVFLGPATLNADGSAASVEWHLACNLPCGVNVCRPPYGLDNTLGGNFAWRVDQLKSDGSSTTGAVWQFSLMASVTYDTRAVADTYIDKKDKNYADKRHMLMWGRDKSNPRFGFVKFDIPPPEYAGVGGCSVSVMSAQMRLVVLSFAMQDVSVYRIPVGEADFDEFDLTSATGKHPGADYPNVFKDSVLENKVYGPVDVYENFTIDVTGAVSEAFDAGNKVVSFGLETSTGISRFCSQSKSNPRGKTKSKETKEVISEDLDAAIWCYPRLEVVLGGLNCPATSQDPSCSLPEGSPAGPLDDMCGTTAPTFPASPAITDWREGTAITTTTTTTTTTIAPPITEGHCRYNDHVQCPWPHSDTMCSGDQCCPDGSTCPSSQFAQAQGCNLKKYDCTAFLPANWTCRESEEVFCPGTDVKCAGDTCCPDGTTCPSASVMQVPDCGKKRVDCQAVFSSSDTTCAIGEFVMCPGSDAKCHGNQCCPDGSTCPSAPAAVAEGCGPKKKTCELLSWDVKLRVTSVVFAKVDEDTKEEVSTLSQQAMATAGGIDASNVGIDLSSGSLIITAKVTPPGGWSQRKFDDSVETNLLSEETRLEMEEMLEETDGLKEASEGDMVFQAIKGERSDAAESTTAAPQANNGAGTEAPSTVQSTSLRGGDTETTIMALDEVSSAASMSLLIALATPLISACQLS
eukprot:gnl/MRDRNA2_/MRDRNA2_29279_c0_seq1.p1 gnl/MRDRNA2_/MRDRNA2_29279_c0~~gnl/MRDRNA2_/MRDRNA2_29279_c0_seq1.p1  ORF type:complete len:1033 (-),score=151.28 gnl/MRDRNA2_/MRDRNA2_29279_c0_seq1:349-3447(-)